MSNSSVRHAIAPALLITAALFIVAGCSKRDPSPPPTPEWDESISAPARLIERLPDETWGYLRVPNLWGLMAAPKEDSPLAPALSSDANQAALRDLQQAMSRELNALFPGAAPAVELLLNDLRSPLEIAAVSHDDQPINAHVVIEARLAFDSLEAINARIEAVAEMHPMARLIRPATAERSGQMFFGPANLFFSFNPDAGRLRMMTGLAVSEQVFDQSAQWPRRESTPPTQIESELDSSRYGLMAWANMQRLWPLIESGIPPESRGALETAGIQKLGSVAFGLGSRDGRGRLALVAQPAPGERWNLAPAPAQMTEFQTRGTPSWLIGYWIPDYAWVQERLMPLIEAAAPDAGETMNTINDGILELSGASLNDWLDGFAGRTLLLSDDHGAYWIQQPTHPDKLAELLRTTPIVFDTRVTDAGTDTNPIHHTHASDQLFSPAPGETDPTSESGIALDPNLKSFMEISNRMDSHLYWMEHENLLYFSDVPQILIDRLNHPGNQSGSDWLTRTGVDTEQALLFGAMPLADAMRRNYYFYLRALTILSDAFDAPLRLETFPTASELALQGDGDGAFSVEFGPERFAISLNYENHPGDLMFGPAGLAAVAGVGIVAAVAVPAYQEYTVRARIAEALEQSLPMQREIEAWYAEHGFLPSAGEITSRLEFGAGAVASIYYQEEPYAVVIELRDGGLIGLFPEGDEAEIIDWSCSTEDVPDGQIPAQCR